MEQPDAIAVTVAYALPEQQSVIALELPSGASVTEAVNRSGLLERFPDIGTRPLKLAIFGRLIETTTILKTGDRVEILRSLARDPKETRRQLAARGRTMGRS